MPLPSLGEIKIVAFDFVPKGWAFCDGQLLPIDQNQPLYALLGNRFGGDGVRTFGLPDLRGRVAVHTGGSGIPVELGGRFGVEMVTLTTSNLPQHHHPMTASATAADSDLAEGNVWASISDNQHPLYAPTINQTMSDQCTTAVGGSQPHENRQPYITLKYLISLTGTFPRP